MIRIVVQQGDTERSSHVLDRTSIRIGRDASNDVVVRDRFVSSRHGEIRIGAEGMTYEDLVTTNGSRVLRGDAVLPVDSTVRYRITLQHGDELLLGDTKCPVRVRFEPAAARVFGSRGIVPPPRAVAPAEIDATHGETMVMMPASFDRDALLALHGLTARLAGRVDQEGILQAMAEGALEAFTRANHVAIWLSGGEPGDFRPALSLGRKGQTEVRPVSRAVRDRVVAAGKAVVFDDHEQGFDDSMSLHDSSIRAGMCAPLWDGHRTFGLVQVDRRGARLDGGFSASDLATLAVFAHQAAMSLANARLHDDLMRGVEQAITGLVAALEAKDPYTAGHSEAVAALCVVTCDRLGTSDALARTIKRAALLHDVGKIGIPYGILNKKGALTAEELDVLRSHVEVGARILAPLGFLADVVPLVLHHHERWDGRGYPARLEGEAIPLGARILAVCDAWHSLVHDSAHRQRVPAAVALAEIRRLAGTHFDPAVVEAFADAVGEHVVRSEAEDAEPVGAR